jgi:hypothetical protein
MHGQLDPARTPAMTLPPITESVLTCPHCGHATVERMPVDACVYFHECARCRTLLRPAAGNCCVFCTYGSVKCPPVQLAQRCCADTDSGEPG